MALRAFHCNPSLGGFGGESGAFQTNLFLPTDNKAKDFVAKENSKQLDQDEDEEKHLKESSSSSDCDAFAQIVKELVDNAVDACSHDDVISNEKNNNERPQSVLKRVRVVIEPVTHDDCNKENADGNLILKNEELLRVTVTDNGCGMENIESCVAAFKTSKTASVSTGENNKNKNNSSKTEGKKQLKKNKKGKSENDTSTIMQQKKGTQTAGRYGIGLTLCMLHAQRLVPNSCASITSTTASSAHWTRASYVVDTDDDAVRCVKKELLPKLGKKDESGTAVGLLVPGGKSAQSAWPRLAEYFARFQLSLGLQCSIQVMASTLSHVPLFIRPPIEMERRVVMTKEKKEGTNDCSEGNMQKDTSKEGEGNNECSVSKDEDEWNDGMIDEIGGNAELQYPHESKHGEKPNKLEGKEGTNWNDRMKDDASDIDWNDFFNDKCTNKDRKSGAINALTNNNISKRKEYPRQNGMLLRYTFSY